VPELPEICFSKAVIQKEKIIYELIGKTEYKLSGVKSWIAGATQILNNP
jgi:hypothetical protein